MILSSYDRIRSAALLNIPILEAISLRRSRSLRFSEIIGRREM
jgi:hypothetical protein